MKETKDHSDYERWLDLELEGALSADESAELELHLAGCATCRDERGELVRLHALLGDSRVPVREGFAGQVMAALPSTAWEGRAPRAWRLPLVAAAVLLTAAGVLLGLASADLGALPAAAGSVTDLFGTAILAGAGLLAASWKGTGLVVQDVFAQTPGGFVALAVLVLGLNLLLVSLVRRRHRATAEVSGER